MSDLTDFIEDIERRYFRTDSDTGAGDNALFIWNRVREHAGMKPLTKGDLRKRERDYYMTRLAEAVIREDTENVSFYKELIQRMDRGRDD